MHRPRPVLLTEAERRALRLMEEAVTAQDPALSLLLDRPIDPERTKRRVRTLLQIYVVLYIVLSVVLFVLGLGAADVDLQETAMVMLLTAPVVGWGMARLIRSRS
jgi:multisubunit Na+/H+ antiporter MnhB subunit